MIERAINKYYIKQLKKEIEDRICLYTNIDFKYEEDKNKLFVLIKDKKYNDSEYVELFYFKKENALLYIINFDEIRVMINEVIKNYLKENK